MKVVKEKPIEDKELKLNALKERYGEIFELKGEYNGEEVIGYFKRPNIKTLEYYFDNYFKRVNSKIENPDFDVLLPELPDNQMYLEVSKVSNVSRNKALREVWKECFVEGSVDLLSEDFNDLFELHKYTLIQLINIHKAELIDEKDVPEDYRGDIKNLFYIKLTQNDTDKVFYAAFKRLSAGLSDMMYDLHDRGKIFAADKMLAEKGFYIGDDEMINFNKYPDFFISYRGLLSNMIRTWSIEFEKKK